MQSVCLAEKFKLHLAFLELTHRDLLLYKNVNIAN